MKAYNAVLKCAAHARFSGLPTVWQRSSTLSRNKLSYSPVQNIHLSALRPSVLTSVLHSSLPKQVLKRDFYMSRCIQSDGITTLAKDVIIFKYDNQKLHKIITLFGMANFAMFMTISLNIYSLLKTSLPGEGEQPSEFDSETSEGSTYSPTSIYQAISDTTSSSLPEETAGSGDSKEPISSTYILTALCVVTFTLGYVVLAGSWLYCNHVVRYIVLHKCGKRVTVITHGAFAKNRYHTWDVDKVSIRGNRAISSAVLLNGKGKYFSYILDNKGTYTNPQLFDATVGISRDLRK